MTVDDTAGSGDDREHRTRRAVIAVAISLVAAVAVATPAALRLDDSGGTSDGGASTTDDGS